MPKLVPNWARQIQQTYRLTKTHDPAIRWILPLYFFGITFGLIVFGKVIGGLALFFTYTSVAWAVLLTTYVFSRRAQTAAFGAVEGVPGAAAQVLSTMLRSGWFVTPGIEVNRAQEVVHRVVGRPGVILVIEAKPGSQIAKSARDKMTRWVSDVPIHEVYVGLGAGQVSLKKLSRTVLKFPKTLRPAEVTELRRRLDAVGNGPALPIPKGPMPKGMRPKRR